MSAVPDEIVFPDTAARVATLGNGLEVIVKEDRSAPVASLQAWCRAGSIHEGGWLGAGLSHFLEHMLFKGTEHRDGLEIARTVQREGGYINAYTSFDRTVYWIDAPASGALACLDVLCDVVGYATLPADEFERESDVIRREIAMGEDNPDQVVSKALFRNAYSTHPCRHPVIGHLDLFNQLSRDDLCAYYREQYSPDNLFLVVVGDVDAEAVLEAVAARLGTLERRPRRLAGLPEEPVQLGCRDEEIPFPTDLHRTRIGWRIPEATHPDVPALDLVAAMLGHGRSSRLYRAVREEKGLAHSVGAYAYAPSFPGQFVAVLNAEPDRAAAAEEALFAEVEAFKTGAIDEAELAKVKRMALSEQLSTLTDMRGQASDLGSNWLLARHLDYTRDYVSELQAIDGACVQHVAAKYLLPQRHTRVSLVPASAAPRAAAGRGGARRSEDVREATLDNGLTLLLLADRRLPFVQASAVFRGGLLAEEPERSGLSRLAATLLSKDTARRSAAEVAGLVESVGGGISSSVGNNSFGVAAGALRTDSDLVLELLGDALLRPAFLESAFQRERQFQLARLREEADRPFAVAMKRLRREIYGGHPYGLELSGRESSLLSLAPDDAHALHQRLTRGGNGVVAVCGDIDLDRIEDRLRERFAAMPAGDRAFADAPDSAIPAPAVPRIEIEHEKEQAILLVGCRTVPLTHPDDPALELVETACSDMASRLFVRVREELGLAYSVGATRLSGLAPGLMVFYASTAPEKLDLVEEVMLEEIELMRRDGLSEEEFERARASWLGSEAIELQGAQALAQTMAVDSLVGLGWDRYRKVPGLIGGLTREDARAAAERYLGEGSRVVLRLARG